MPKVLTIVRHVPVWAYESGKVFYKGIPGACRTTIEAIAQAGNLPALHTADFVDMAAKSTTNFISYTVVKNK